MTTNAPTYNSGQFHCPFCNVFAAQTWNSVKARNQFDAMVGTTLAVSRCASCSKSAVWDDNVLVYPPSTPAPHPNPEMPDEIAVLYLEAAAISSRSPRAAGALLRLAVDRLCMQLTGKNNGINQNIAELKRRGLPTPVIRVMDAVRIIGNECVHPGEIDADDPETVAVLFPLLNRVVESLIELPKQSQELFESLPQSKRDAVAQRDRTADQ
ncbi:MAG: DUF4145 domain-containing protein [bacterium]|nr:DUF4145 domain-containing protein [bacterium]